MIKDDIRKSFLKKRREFSPCFVHFKSNIIQNTIFDKEWYKNSSVIMVYVSFENEVETHNIINNALENGKDVIVPVCTDENNLIPVKIQSLNDMRPNRYGILEPVETKIYEGNIDAIIIPGVAFDRDFNRVGFGRGYYDRFLSKNRNPLKVGICFDDQICDKIDTDDNDIPMDIVITEKEYLSKND